MKASRSLGSTAAPHLIILSTSFVQAALLRRCCTMMRASWQEAQAAAAFACKGPAGNCSMGEDWATAVPVAHNRASTNTANNDEGSVKQLALGLNILSLD